MKKPPQIDQEKIKSDKTRRFLNSLKARGGKMVCFKCEKDILERLEGIRLGLGLENRQQTLEFIVLDYKAADDSESMYDK